MRLIGSYLRKHLQWILLLAGLLIIQSCFMNLLEINSGDRHYLVLISTFIAVVFLFIDFFRYAYHFHQIEKSVMGYVKGSIDFPQPQDMQEACYQELVENMNIDRRMAFEQMAKNQQEMFDYYSIWVHQIKTPISALKLLLQVLKNHFLKEDETCDNCVEIIGDLEEEVFRVEEYVNMALQIQRIHSPQNDYVLKEHALDKMIREGIHKYAKTMIRNQLHLEYQRTEEIVVTDDKWCVFVLDQILSNAIKYSNGGDISIVVKKEGDWSYLQILDEGIGISEQDIPRVFEKGYTGYNGHSDKRSTGIGLYLCKEILEKLGHTISITSEVGKGTCVSIGFLQKKRDVRD